MNSACAEFRSAINELRQYIFGLQIEWSLIAALDKRHRSESDSNSPIVIDIPAGKQQIDQEQGVESGQAEPKALDNDILALEVKLLQHVGSGIRKKQFDYNSVIVSLYGLLEQYVERLLSAYTVWLNGSYELYSSIPVAIQKSHMDRTLALLGRLDAPRYKNTLTAATLIRNLNSCLSDDSSFSMNPEAFSYHTANFRSGVIESQAAQLGIPNMTTSLRYYPPFCDYLSESLPECKLDLLTPNEIFFTLDDLADRRNEVAHGSPSQLLSNETLLEYVDYIDNFGSSLYQWLADSTLSREIQTNGEDIGVPIAVHRNAIVCFSLNSGRVACGDRLVAVTGDTKRPYLSGQILNLEVSGVSFPEVLVATGPIKVAALVDFKAKSNHSFFLLRAGADSKEAQSPSESQRQLDFDLGPIDESKPEDYFEFPNELPD